MTPITKSSTLESASVEALSEQTNFSLQDVVTPQVDARIATGRELKKRSLGIEPVSAQTVPSAEPVSKISKQAAITVVVSASEDIVSDQSLSEPGASPSLSEATTAASRGASSINEVLGTNRDDNITATLQPDFIDGLRGNDTIRGDNGDDIIVGSAGNDVISGDHVPSRTTQSNDTITGGSGNDQLFGRIGNDLLIGSSGNDQIFGGSGSDRINGGSGDDQIFGGIVDGDRSFNPGPDERDVLIGGSGNDFIDGGEGNDVILGTNARAAGAGEIDLLTGGGGRDTFVLGSRTKAFYTRGGASQDFGLILDFQKGDRIRLFGDASDYTLFYDAAENSTALGYLGGGGFELVGVLTDTELTDAALNTNAFQFI